MAHLSEDEIVRRACIYAAQDRVGFLAAQERMPDAPAAREAESFLRQLRRLQHKRWPAPAEATS